MFIPQTCHLNTIKSTTRRTQLISNILSNWNTKQWTHGFAIIGTIKGAIWGTQLRYIINPKCASIIKPKCDYIIKPICRAKYFTICKAKYDAFIRSKCFSVSRSKLCPQRWSYKHSIKITIWRAQHRIHQKNAAQFHQQLQVYSQALHQEQILVWCLNPRQVLRHQ